MYNCMCIYIYDYEMNIYIYIVGQTTAYSNF